MSHVVQIPAGECRDNLDDDKALITQQGRCATCFLAPIVIFVILLGYYFRDDRFILPGHTALDSVLNWNRCSDTYEPLNDTFLSLMDEEMSRAVKEAAAVSSQVQVDDVSSIGDRMLCIVAGVSSEDREYAKVMARSVWSGWPQDEEIPADVMRLFVYPNNVPTEGSPQSLFEDGVIEHFMREEERFAHESISEVTGYATAVSFQNMSENNLFDSLLLNAGYSTLPDLLRAAAYNSTIRRVRDTYLATAAISFVLSTYKSCSYLLMANGVTMFTSALANLRFEGTSTLHSLQHLKCGVQSFSHAKLCPAQVSEGEYTLHPIGVVIPVALIGDGSVTIQMSRGAGEGDALKPRTDELSSDETSLCAATPVTLAVHPEVKVLHQRRLSGSVDEHVARVVVVERPRYPKYITPARLLLPRGSSRKARTPCNLCVLVRTFMKEKRLVDNLIVSVLANSPTGRVKVFLVNGNVKKNEMARQLEESFLRTEVVPKYASLTLNDTVEYDTTRGTEQHRPQPVVSFLGFEELNSTFPAAMKRIDPFGYAVTDAALRSPAMVNWCDYYLVTNGDNLYTSDFSHSVFSVLDGSDDNSGAAATSGDTGIASSSEPPPDFVYFNLASRYHNEALDTWPRVGWIDLGASIFSREQSLHTTFVRNQRTRYEWATSDGTFFATLAKRIPPSKQKKISRLLFLHQ